MTRLLLVLLATALLGLNAAIAGPCGTCTTEGDNPCNANPCAADPCGMEEENSMPELGLTLGSMAPEITATDPDGSPVNLYADLLHQDQWIVLVPYRGGWCPFCNLHLQEIAGITTELDRMNARLVAISVDVPDEATKTIVKDELDFLVLSDPSAQMLRDYNLVNRIPNETYDKYVNEYKFDIEDWSNETHHIVAHPAVIILDPAGRITFFHVDPDYKVRMTGAEIVEALKVAQTPVHSSDEPIVGEAL